MEVDVGRGTNCDKAVGLSRMSEMSTQKQLTAMDHLNEPRKTKGPINRAF